MIVRFAEDTKYLNSNVESFNTLQNFMKVVFKAQMLMIGTGGFDFANDLGELVDNIRTAALNPHWTDKVELGEAPSFFLVEVEVPLKAANALLAIHKARPEDEGIGFYVSLLENLAMSVTHEIMYITDDLKDWIDRVTDEQNDEEDENSDEDTDTNVIDGIDMTIPF